MSTDFPVFKFAVSNVCSAFDERTVGSKVVNKMGFIHCLARALREHDFSRDKTPGQHVVELTDNTALATVSSGVGRASSNPDDYVLCEHRGKVGAYLQRRYADLAETCSVVVYTLDAYLKDPDVDEDEARRIGKGVTHVIVAVLAGPKDPPQLSPYRFVHNLAGGNRDYAPEKLTVQGLVEQAKAILAEANKHSRVAD